MRLNRNLALACGIVAWMLAAHASPAAARGEQFTFKIPPQRIPLKLGNQPMTTTAWGTISIGSTDNKTFVLGLQLDADLTDLQQNATGLLRAQLDKDDRCGDQIAIQHVELEPAGPAARAVVQLHYNRNACFKVFGKRQSRKLIGGNGIIQMKFTPVVENHESLRLSPQVESVQADGPLGQLLRSGALGNMVRERITKALLAALEKGTDRSLTLPPAVQNLAAIDGAQFQNEGAGRLGLALEGQVVITPEQIRLIKTQLRERLATRP